MITGEGHTSTPTLNLWTPDACAPRPYSMAQRGHLKLNPVRSEFKYPKFTEKKMYYKVKQVLVKYHIHHCYIYTCTWDCRWDDNVICHCAVYSSMSLPAHIKPRHKFTITVIQCSCMGDCCCHSCKVTMLKDPMDIHNDTRNENDPMNGY